MPKHALFIEGESGGMHRVAHELYPTEPNTANVFCIGSNIYAYTYKLTDASTRILDIDCGPNINCVYMMGDVSGGLASWAQVDTRSFDWALSNPIIHGIDPRDSSDTYLGGFVNFTRGIVHFGGQHEFYPFFAHNFIDTFNRSDDALTIGGSGWSVHNRQSSSVAAVWGIDGSQAVCEIMPLYGGTAQTAMLLHDAESGDFDMTITLGPYVEGGSFSAPIAAFRVNVSGDDGANGLGAWILTKGFLVRLRSNEGGSTMVSLLADLEEGGVVKISARGDNIKVYYNDTKIAEVTDDYNMTETHHGLASFDPSFAHFKFDEVTIQS